MNKHESVGVVYIQTGNLKNKKENAITLVALVITIILLLILAGISIISLKNNGIIEKAAIARNEYENKQIEEEQYLNNLESEIENETSVKKEVGSTIEGVKIVDKEYSFTCIDTNYQGYNLYLCNECIPYSICGPYGSTNYAVSTLRTWLNNNAPKDAIEITLEDTGTQEKMFLLSKEENEKYEKYTAIPWEGTITNGNGGAWTRTYAGNAGWMYHMSSQGVIDYLDITWTAWLGCKPVYVSDK